MTTVVRRDSGILEIPLSALEHWAYCPRQAAMIHTEVVWSESADTVRGDLSHRVVDLPGARREAGLVVVRSLPVWSEVHGLRGVCDIVEFAGTVATPVEYKVGKYVPGGPAELQLAGQALCLREAGFEVTMGFIYSVAERRRHPVPIDEFALARVAQATVDIRQQLQQPRLPPAVNDARCRRCSLRDDCLPELTQRTRVAVDLFTPKPLGQWND